MKRIALAAGTAALLLALPAAAQLYKCKGPDGKVVYSDAKCEGSDKGALKVTPMSTTPSERERARAEEAAKAKELAQEQAGKGPQAGQPPTSAAMPAAPAPYRPTGGDEERIRSLEMTMNSLGASTEQKSAARSEIAYIRSGRDSRLSSDERSRRDSLRADMTSTDAKKRKQALEQFRSLYD